MNSITDLYDEILHTANQLIRNATHIEMHVLRDRDPTYEEVADNMEALAVIINALAVGDDPMIGVKALDYVELIRKVAVAIRNNEEVLLSELVKELNAKPFC